MDGWMAFSNVWMPLRFSEMVRVQDCLSRSGATATVCVTSIDLLRRPFLISSTDEGCDA